MVLKGKGPVYTDNQWKQFKYRHEVPKKVLEDQFDWLDEEMGGYDGFFKYRNRWYHLDEFMRIDSAAPDWMRKWHGYSSDSFFSGILIKVSDDGEEYMVGTYIT